MEVHNSRPWQHPCRVREQIRTGHDRRHHLQAREDDSAREIRESLLWAGNTFGNRVAEISNAKLPKKPTKTLTQEIIELYRLDSLKQLARLRSKLPRRSTPYLAQSVPALCQQCAK
jgi:hypothetical protein